MESIDFQCINFEKLKEKILKNNFRKKTIFNFFNSHDIYQYKNTEEFKEVLDNKKIKQKNFIDGFMISLILSLKNLKKVSRLRGPAFTYAFLKDRKLNKNKKHFFIGIEKKDLEKISKNSSLETKNIYNYNPSFIDGNQFSEEEINKIVKKINKIKPDYLWIAIGCPKQNILSFRLYDKCNFNYCFNVGAGLDFFLGKKKRAPKIWQNLGLEWLYRLITDFKYSKKKVWRSLLGSFYALSLIKLNDKEIFELENKDSNKKKILFLSPLPPPYYGSAVASEEILKFLKKSNKFEVKNIKLNYSKEMSDTKLNSSKIYGFFKVKRKIKKFISRFKPNIIYFMPATSNQGLTRDYLFVRKIKKYCKEKILFHIRTRITEEDWKNPFYKKMYKEMLYNQKIIVLDKFLKKDLRGLVKDEQIFVLPDAIKNNLSDNQFDGITKKRKEEDNFNILFLSHMEKNKGWFKLLQSCKILNERYVNFNCNFVGAWPGEREKKEFYSFVKDNNLQNKVKYLGKKIGNEKNKILENSDVLVFPTEYKLETFGLVILEAMMFGLPVIANGIAAIPTTVQHDKTGFVLKENSPEEIVKYIEELKNHKEKRIKMGKAGRERFLEYYTLEKYKDKFNDTLLKMIKKLNLVVDTKNPRII